MVMGSFFLYMDRRTVIVTFFLAGSNAAPRGEWELHRGWVGCGSVNDRGLAIVRGVLDLVPRYSNKPHDLARDKAILDTSSGCGGIL